MRTSVVLLCLAVGAATVAGCGSSAAPAASSSPVAACRGYVLDGVRPGDSRTYRVTSSTGKTVRETLRLRAHTGDSYTFRRTITGRPATDEVYRVHGCAVELPARTVTRGGIAETISGLTLPALSRLGDGESTVTTATVSVRLGDRHASRPVTETVTGRGHQRITVPAGTFDALKIELDYTLKTRLHTMTERETSWVTAQVGTVRAVSSAVTDGVTARGATVELLKAR